VVLLLDIFSVFIMNYLLSYRSSVNVY